MNGTMMTACCFRVSRAFAASSWRIPVAALLLLAVSPTLAGYSWSRANQQWFSIRDEADGDTTPEFAPTIPSREVSVLRGHTALLPCIVRNLQDKVVSWIRTRDLHILTSGVHVFTSDSRFEVVHKYGTDFWGLKIRKILLSDAGKYECQVNTDPKMNRAMILTVTDTHMHDSPIMEGGVAVIEGPSERFVRVGSPVTFTCVLTRLEATLGRPQLRWTVHGEDITTQNTRGGISVDTDYRDPMITSRLTVAAVKLEDAGNYTCSAPDVEPASVTLVAVEGERSEAMLRDFPNTANTQWSSSLTGYLFCILLIYR